MVPSLGFRLPLVVLLLASALAPIAEASWLPSSFSANRLDAWTAAPSDPTRLYGRAADLSLRSDDAGRTWQTLPRPPFGRWAIPGLFVHPSDPDLLAGVAFLADAPGTTFVAFSRDGGRSWELVEAPGAASELLGFDHVGSFFIASAVNVGELWRSDDLGASWTEITPEPLVNRAARLHSGDASSVVFVGGESPWRVSFDSGRTFREVAVGPDRRGFGSIASPADSKRLVVDLGDDVVVTTDGFETWSQVDFPGRFFLLRYHPRRAGWLVGHDPDPASSVASLVRVSKDDGSTWTSIPVPDADSETLLIFDPCDDNVVYARRESHGLARIFFDDTPGGAPEGTVTLLDAPSPELAVLDARPGPGCEMLVRTRAGLYALRGQGETWTAIGDGLPIPVTASLQFDPRDFLVAWAATYGGLATSDDGGVSWSLLPALAGRPIREVLASASDDRLLLLDDVGHLLLREERDGRFEATQLAAERWVVDPFVPGALLVYRPFTASGWSRIVDYDPATVQPTEIVGALPGEAIDQVAFDPTLAGRAMAVGRSGTLLVSNDSGLRFNAVGTIPNLGGGLVRGLRLTPRGEIWVWTDARILRSSDGGATFEELEIVARAPGESIFLADLVVDRRAADTLYAIGAILGGDSGPRPMVRHSVDGGATWSDRSDGFEGWALALAQSPHDPDRIVAAGHRLFVLDDGVGAACVDSATRLCLRQGRFEVTLDFEDPATVTARAAEVVADRTDESGLFTFFDPDNWEMMVKVLDGCGVNQRFWVFAAATTDLGYTLRVVDRATGIERAYDNPPGRSSPAIVDTDAFATCDAAP